MSDIAAETVQEAVDPALRVMNAAGARISELATIRRINTPGALSKPPPDPVAFEGRTPVLQAV